MRAAVGNLLLGGPEHGKVWATPGHQSVITMVLPPEMPPPADWHYSPETVVRPREGYYRVRKCVEWIGLIEVRQPGVAFGGTEAWWEWWVGVWQGVWPNLEPEDYRLEEYLLAMRLLQLLIPRADTLFEPPPALTEVTLCTQKVVSMPSESELLGLDWDLVERRMARIEEANSRRST